MNFANFVVSDKGYLAYCHALLNSLEQCKIYYPLYFLHYKIPQEYFIEANKLFSFEIIPVELTDEDFNNFKVPNKNLFLKQSRFKFIQQYAAQYDAVCMFDADMFLVSPNFSNFYNLVANTRYLIGCNERYKWQFTNRYIYNEAPIFQGRGIKATKFHCSVPIIFDYKQWVEVFNFYNELMLYGEEIHPKNGRQPIGDMFCWNISVCKNKRENDIVLFPMETMTQVHYSNVFPWTRIFKDGTMWRTFAGDEVYSVHGRICNPNWATSQINGYKKHCQNYKMQEDLSSVNLVIKQTQNEWFKLVYDGVFPLDNFVPRATFNHMVSK